MSKISRRDLLMAGAGTSAAAGLMTAASPLVARAGEVVHGVHIHAVFVDAGGPGNDIVIDEWAFGTPADLNGTTRPRPRGTRRPSAPASTHGRASTGCKNRIELTGTTIFANDPASLDAPVTTVVDTTTGEITWTFATFEFTGTATVTIF